MSTGSISFNVYPKSPAGAAVSPTITCTDTTGVEVTSASFKITFTCPTVAAGTAKSITVNPNFQTSDLSASQVTKLSFDYRTLFNAAVAPSSSSNAGGYCQAPTDCQLSPANAAVKISGAPNYLITAANPGTYVA